MLTRPRLFELLDAATAPVILLHAPAGYGKTTLAKQWTLSRDLDHVWYGANVASSDYVVLCRELIARFREIRPNAGQDALNLLFGRASVPGIGGALADSLVTDLRDLERQWLVIDDYHHLSHAPEAERFVEVLASAGLFRLLIASRERPQWASARKNLYGEVYEVSMSALAMTDSEADEILSPLGDARAAERVRKLARGWPAVLGLAAFGSRRRLVHGQLETTLYDYVAEEIFDALPLALRQDVLRLGIVRLLSPATGAFLFGSRRDSVIVSISDAGLLTSVRPPAVHPLLRSFLRQKILADETVLREAEKLARYLIGLEEWDDAFEVITTFGFHGILPALLEAAFRKLLAENRNQTLSRWVDAIRDAGVDSPVVDLVAAELSVRAGRLAHAELLASSIARSATTVSFDLRARGLLVAARAAQLRSDEERSLSYLEEIGPLPVSTQDAAEIAWLRFLVSNELERPDTKELLEAFESLIATNFDHHVRALTGRGILASRFDTLREALIDVPSIKSLAKQTTPVVRSSFLVRCAYLLLMAARYDEASEIITDGLDVARATKLDFVLPHALLVKAGIAAGLKRYRAADAALRESAFLGPDDEYVTTNASALRARVLCMSRQPRLAAEQTEKEVSQDVTPCVRAEYRSAHGLALACLGDASHALRIADEISAITDTKEANSLAAGIRVISALHRKNVGEASTLLDAFIRGDFHDPIVVVYRSFPDILQLAVSMTTARSFFASLTRRANDEALSVAAGLSEPEVPSRLAALTNRERHVLQLIAEGASNREIADRLVISEATVKAHVHRILTKLGVRSRTEAIIQTAEHVL